MLMQPARAGSQTQAGRAPGVHAHDGAAAAPGAPPHPAQHLLQVLGQRPVRQARCPGCPLCRPCQSGRAVTEAVPRARPGCTDPIQSWARGGVEEMVRWKHLLQGLGLQPVHPPCLSSSAAPVKPRLMGPGCNGGSVWSRTMLDTGVGPPDPSTWPAQTSSCMIPARGHRAGPGAALRVQDAFHAS